MPRVSRENGAGAQQATVARDARDRLAALGEVAATFESFRPQAEVIRNVEAVPTIFPWYDHVTLVGGHPISRFCLVHGPSAGGKTLLTLGLIASFLRRYHFAALIDAERTTTATWVQQMVGEFAVSPGFTALPVGTYEQVRAAVRDYCEKIAAARAKGKVPQDTTGLLVLDSIRKLYPQKLWEELAKATAADVEEAKPRGKFAKRRKPGIDGMGGRAGQIKAAFNAAWVDELIPLLADTRTAMVVIARETEDADADVFASRFEGKKWKIGGGSALFYEASLDIRVTQSWVTVGDAVVGERHQLAVWKTKVADKEVKVPTAYFHTRNRLTGTVGFDLPRDIVMLGMDIGVITANGGWLAIGKRKLGQGTENVIDKLHNDPALLAEIEQQVRAASAKGYVQATQL